MRRIASTLCALTLAACATSGTRLVDSYRAPGTVSIVLNRAAMLVMNGGPDVRASLEDEIVAGGNRARLIPAHTVLGPDDMRSVDAVRQKLLDQKFDGLVVLRVVRSTEIDPHASMGDSITTYAESAPPGEQAFGGKALLEASIYELSDEKLIWTGLVETEPSKDAKAVVRAAAKVVREQLRDTGLLHD